MRLIEGMQLRAVDEADRAAEAANKPEIQTEEEAEEEEARQEAMGDDLLGPAILARLASAEQDEDR